jgi:hypothetical protein
MIRPMRSRRIVHAAFMVLALLFSQWVVALHACNMSTPPSAQAAHDVAAPCCPDPAVPNACEQHCDFGHSAVDHAKSAATLDVTLGPALVVRMLEPARLHLRIDRPPAVAPDPPSSIRFSVLRI